MWGQTQEVFNTDFYWVPPGTTPVIQGVSGQSPAATHPALPALWWLGFLIALVVIRVASDRA